MRRATCALLLAAAVGMFVSARADAAVAVSLSYFHQTLAPHGRWLVAASYGDVWVPNVAAGWEPYVDGDWAYTDYGWTWVSDDSWGDIPYHYGTWAWVDPYGWVWIPGTVWAPAWVTWAYTDDYVGWAPVPPTFVLSAGGYVGSPIVVAQTRYVFVPARQFVGVPVASVRVPAQQNAAIFARATKVTRFPVSGGIVHTAGIPRAQIERAAGHRIAAESVSRARVTPTSIAQARVGTSKRVAVVAPAVERQRVMREHGASAPKSASSADRRAAERARVKESAASRNAAHDRAATSHAAKPHQAPARRQPETHAVERPHGNEAHGTAAARSAEHHAAPAHPENRSRGDEAHAAPHRPVAPHGPPPARPDANPPRHATPDHQAKNGHEKPKSSGGKPEGPDAERL